MLSEYLELLDSKLELVESFKQNQISKIIAFIDAKISKTLSTRKIISTYETLSQIELNAKIVPYFHSKRNEKGVPFTNFASEPDNITQIKKVINALYYARLAFEDLENVDIRNLRRSPADLALLYNETIHKAYEASFLLTHLDVDIKDMFSEEFALIQPLIAQFETFFNTHSANTKEIAKQFKVYPLSYKAGEITSIAVEQMKPNSGDLDYNLLTQFSADLPGYIDKITHYINQYSSKIIETAPNLKKEKIEELQNTALKLLNDLEKIKGNSLFLSFKVLNYIHILRNILTLSMSALEQIGNLNDSSQDLIRDKLSTLKYSVLPNLFALVDKIEDNTMLTPGSLSIPLMKKIKPFYQTLIYYASKPVNFAKKGKELTNIEDSRFLALRLERTYKRIDAAEKALFKINKVQEALNEFYNIIKDSKCEDKALHQLPPAIKKQLIEQYKILKPYMMKVDVNLNDLIIQSLTSNKNPSSFVASSFRWVTGQLPADHMSFVWKQREALQTLITKKINTQKFHQDLNKDLIDSVQKTADLILFPYNEPKNVFVIDESEAVSTLACSLVKLFEAPTPAEMKDYSDSRYILTKTGFYYYNKLENTLKPIKTNAIQLKKLLNLFCKNKLVTLTETQLQQITTISAHSHPILQFKIDKETEKALGVDIDHKLLANPELLSTDQALDLSQWYKNKHTKFMVARDAYAEFIELLNQQNPTKNGILDLEHLDKATKAQCRNLYNLFQPYFVSGGLQTEHKMAIKPFDHYVTYALSIPDTPEINLFSVLETHVLPTFTPAQKEAYDEFMTLLKQHHVTDVQPLNFKNLPEPIKTKCRNLYNLFQPQFSKTLAENANCEKTIRDLDRAVDYKELITTFNSYIIFSLSDEVPPAKPVNLFVKLSDYVQTKFTAIDMNWHAQSEAYLKIANKKFLEEYEATQLTQDINSKARAHHLIPHTNYSKFIKEFRTSLYEITSYLNEPMQKSLAIAKEGLPFPELEHAKRATAENQILAQNKQALGLKRIFNSLYHIEGIVLQLENLDNTQYESVYVWYLLIAYSHLNEIIKLSQNLVKDPHFGLIARDVLDKAQTILATIQEQSDAYQVSHVDVATPGSVQINGLWYTLNTFFVIPIHIRSLSNNTYLTSAELQEVHIKAKTSTLRIEAIIKNSHSYFKLLMQTPDMIRLYQDLTNKLNEFISTSHDTVMDNLGKIRAEFLTPMLIEADKWEDKLGLKPGSISDTLKNVTDEYFKGLLLHLNLDSKTHIALVTDRVPLEQRKVIANKKIEEATKRIVKLEKNYATIETLFKHLTTYERLQKEFLLSVSVSHTQIKQSLADTIIAYKKALPHLAQVQKKLGPPFNNNSVNMVNYQKALTELINLQKKKKSNPQLELDYRAASARIEVLKNALRFELRDKHDLEYDILLNSDLNKFDPILTQIYPLISSSYHYYLGLKASTQMQLATAQEKLKHLNELSQIQEKANTQFILEYTTNSFDTEMKKVADRPIGLQYLHEEYKIKLAQFLLQFKDQIIKESLKEVDKNAAVRNLLKIKTELFEKNIQSEFRQLDSVGMALDQFRLYFNQANLAIRSGGSLFEDVQTLDKKTDYINRLDKIAKDSTLPIKTRFEQINHIVVKNPNFARVILAHKEENHWSFTYLIHCFLSLLEAIYLYTPARKAHYNNLHDAVSRFKFFPPPPAPEAAATAAPNLDAPILGIV